MKVCVLGLGYIGLPTSAMLATHGHDVLGVDIHPKVVESINQGNIHIEEPGLQAFVRSAVVHGRLKAASAPEEADVFIICVPTPLLKLEKRADLTFVEEATRSILPVLKKGDLVILESTVPPGTTRDVLAPIIAGKGLEPGRDVMLAHCPETVLPGAVLHELTDTDRIIGGWDAPSTEMATKLYKSFCKGRLIVTDATTAEFVKLLGNTYRDVNIALANEMALIAEKVGVNVWEAIELVNRHPRVHLHNPGPGVGGHCIAVDPWFLHEKAPASARVIALAREVNDSMPGHVVELVRQAVGEAGGTKVALLGLAYKPDIDDIRESPALDVAVLLKEKGYEVAAHDPHVVSEEVENVSLAEAMTGADCAVIAVDHREFKALGPEAMQAMNGRIIIDTRDCLDAERWQAAGFTIIKLGKGR